MATVVALLLPGHLPEQVELAGAVMTLGNRNAVPGGWLLVIFMIPVTFAVHGFEIITTDSEQMRAIRTSFFFKRLTMTGAALLISQLGVRANRTP